MAVATATALLAVAATATAGSLYQQNKAAGYQKKGLQAQRKQAELSHQRTRRDSIRSARAAYALSQVTAEGQGVSGSSGSRGGGGSILSQMGSNLSFLDRGARLSDQASAMQGRAISAGNAATMFSGIAKLATMGASAAPVKASTAIQAHRYPSTQAQLKGG